MTTRKPADENGNELAPLDPHSDTAHLIHLLEWARVRGFTVGPMVQVGNVIVQVRDMRTNPVRSKDKDDAEPDIYAAHGYDGE